SSDLWPTDARVTGYEIHHGESDSNSALFPFAALSDDQQICGSYIHGLFEQGEFRRSWLESVGCRNSDATPQAQRTLASLDLLADTLKRELAAEYLTPLLAPRRSLQG
ncbi:MAG: hypothetical protein Q9M13_04780, partial [Mariprofundales bacterium]|nr:hypothetical protein [Mariprofundales bacterium]